MALTTAQRETYRLLLRSFTAGDAAAIDTLFGVTGGDSSRLSTSEREKYRQLLRSFAGDAAAIDALFSVTGGDSSRLSTDERSSMANFLLALDGNPSALDVIANLAFNGDFSTIFPGALQSVQTDRGLTYGGTTLASNGGGPIGTLTGTLATTPVPILFTCTNGAAIGSGATFSASYDGGATSAMTGITPAVGVPVALTGAATGLSHAWAAGTAVLNDTWTATCSALADQSGNLRHYSQASPAAQPTITVGMSGKPGLLFNGTTQFLRSTFTTPNPTTNPFLYFIVFRHLAWAANNAIVSDGAHTSLAQRGSSPIIQMALTSFGCQAPLALNTWGVGEAALTNSTSDYVRMGAAAAVTGTSAGNGAGSGSVDLAHTSLFAQFTNMEILALVVAPMQSTAAARAAVASFYGGGVAV